MSITTPFAGLIMSERLLSKLRHKLNDLTPPPSYGQTSDLEPSLLDVTRRCIECHVIDETSHVTQPRVNCQVVLGVSELIAGKQPTHVTSRFMELLTIAGV